MDKEQILDHVMTFSGGGMSRAELGYLYDFCKDKTVLELGSMYGQSSYVIASVARHLTCVDAWQDGTPFLEERQRLIYRRVPQNMEEEFDRNMRGFTNVYKVKAYTSDYEPLHTFDIILIDADHSYEGCKADIQRYRGLTTQYIMFHDYNTPTWPGVKKAVNEAQFQMLDLCGYLVVCCI